MSKYSYEEKIEAVLRVLNEGMSYRESAHILGANKSDVIKWVALYKANSYAGLVSGEKSYDGEFKIMVVKYMYENHLSCRTTVALFGVKSHSNVSKWEQIYYEEGPAGLFNKKPRASQSKGMAKKKLRKNELSEETREELIAEVQQLRMENEYLKKLNALVHKRVAQENGNEPPSSMN